MSRGSTQRRDMCTQQPRLTISQVNIALRYLDTPLPEAFHLPSLQRHAGLKSVIDGEIETRFLVGRDPGRCSFLIFRLVHFVGFASSYRCRAGIIRQVEPKRLLSGAIN